ncbi:bacteriocin biosynthesis protein [Streptomyces sp. ventii]|uniref:Bacteriocin biosynthesis protein n=1 Tax=Streptomyces spiramenti TaxID=2720606 RepID=A0ABX1AM29_9ACTN|nr:bacteriocin biosynthesis protein [Streptomyces spiramenti]
MHEPDAIEDAVLAVLAGATVEEAARTAGTQAAALSEAIERYRAAGRAALDAEPSAWHQANIRFRDYASGDQVFRSYLAPALHGGPVGTWWFVRKHPHWRLRYHPAVDASPEDAVRHVSEALESSVSLSVVTEWTSTRYEPEAIAFGGPVGVMLAHKLFHADSVGVLGYLGIAADRRERTLDAKTTSLFAMTLLMRAAGLEFGEQGDVWGRVEERRPLPGNVSPEQASSMVEPMRHLLLSDARPLLDAGALASVRSWIERLEHSGRALATAAGSGKIGLGKRGVLARHVLFHWNRMGFDLRQQSIWSRAAREAVLDR